MTGGDDVEDMIAGTDRQLLGTRANRRPNQAALQNNSTFDLATEEDHADPGQQMQMNDVSEIMK